MTPRRLSADLVLLHWMVALLMIIAVGAILSRGELAPGDPWRPMLRQWHMGLGVAVFIVGVARLAVRLWRGVPALAPEAAGVRWLRRSVELGLYGVVLVQPWVGVLHVQSGGKPVHFLSLQLPQFMAEHAGTHHQLGDWHQALGNAFYGLLATHVAAALWHHFVRGDSVLSEMLTLKSKPAFASHRAAGAVPASHGRVEMGNP